MFKAADLNLTFDDSEVEAGDADFNGNFDGVNVILEKMNEKK